LSFFLFENVIQGNAIWEDFSPRNILSTSKSCLLAPHGKSVSISHWRFSLLSTCARFSLTFAPLCWFVLMWWNCVWSRVM